MTAASATMPIAMPRFRSKLKRARRTARRAIAGEFGGHVREDVTEHYVKVMPRMVAFDRVFENLQIVIENSVSQLSADELHKIDASLVNARTTVQDEFRERAIAHMLTHRAERMKLTISADEIIVAAANAAANMSPRTVAWSHLDPTAAWSTVWDAKTEGQEGHDVGRCVAAGSR